jgi:hypothetical protein
MIFEGRLLHGTGVNKSAQPRTILVMNAIKPFMRQQELHLFSASSEILTNASDKLLYRLGAIPKGLGGIEGAWNGDRLLAQRLAMESGEYRALGQLSADSDSETLAAAYSYRFSEVGLRQEPFQRKR